MSEDKIGDFFRFPPSREEQTRGLVCAVVVMRSQIVCPVRRGEERRGGPPPGLLTLLSHPAAARKEQTKDGVGT